jgi:hypothetical protein
LFNKFKEYIILLIFFLLHCNTSSGSVIPEIYIFLYYSINIPIDSFQVEKFSDKSVSAKTHSLFLDQNISEFRLRKSTNTTPCSTII